MSFARPCLASALCGAALSSASALCAAPFPEFVDPNPAAGNQFGQTVVALSTGNVVITSPMDDFAGVNAGAVYLFNGSTGALISTLRGSAAFDQIGSSVTALSNGSYVVVSLFWDNAAVVEAGAVTWGSGTSGVSGTVSAANSLVGVRGGDQVGSGGVTALSNGNYVVVSPNWDNGAAAVNAGAVTWGSGTSGVSGTISAANSLVGSTAGDNVGSGGVPALSNGNYVVGSPNWDNGATVNVGAATWGSGTSGISGAVSAANSLVGSAAGDNVGTGVTALSNGNYVVRSPNWDNGAIANAGAATWGSGTSGVNGTVSAANSLVGSTAGDFVGNVAALSNGNYVVGSPSWSNGAIVDAGAATWGSGTSGVSGAVSAANSLVGSTANDFVGFAVAALASGNYVVVSPNWDNGVVADAGAATWGSGTSGVSGTVSVANSLVGSTASDEVGSVTALSNGNYVVRSPSWDNGAIVNVGAVTWGSGTIGVSGTVSTANSLVGSTAGDNVGTSVTALSNGNYVVRSPSWDNASITDAGAVTWASGTNPVSIAVSAANSLVGSTASDQVGSAGVTALTNGNYVVRSPNWDNGAITNAGSVTWGNGTSPVSIAVSAGNSLVGSTASDQIGSGLVTALSNGTYVVNSPSWDHGATVDAGAATWGTGVVSGAVSAENSIVGAAASAGLQSLSVEGIVDGTFFARFLTEGGGRVRVGPPGHLPVIVSATDIPDDQGGWLRLTFSGSSLDGPNGSPPISRYGVWRRVPSTLITSAGKGDPVPAETATALPPGTWELLSNIPALQQPQYVIAAPTISNAAPNEFVITAHTTTPTVWYSGNPASGQSVDNIAPAQPTGFTAAYASGQTNLQWTANTENDLGAYRLYRGASADFTPSPGNIIASQVATNYADVGPAGSYYKLSAVDVNGNESNFALVTPQQTTDVGDDAPVVFALHGARPNPATGHELSVAFALPSPAPARLELLDVGGRRVVAREVGTLGAGRHTVSLGGGREVAPGIYWLRLIQGTNQQRMRVAVIR